MGRETRLNVFKTPRLNVFKALFQKLLLLISLDIPRVMKVYFLLPPLLDQEVFGLKHGYLTNHSDTKFLFFVKNFERSRF